MIRLLLVIPTLDRSGAEKQFTLLATRLPKAEFDVRVVALTRGGPYLADLQQSGVPVDILHKRFKLDPIALWRLRRIIRDWQPEIIHSWLFAANSYCRLVAGKRPRVKLIVSERCVDTWKSRRELWLDRRLAARTARLVANSQSVADFYQQAGFPAEKIAIIRNGVEIPALEPAARRRARAMLQLSESVPVIGSIGRLARQKRLDDVIWAFELVRCLRGEVRLVIAGDGPERARLERFAREIQVDGSVQFLGHRADAAELWPGLDVFWLASDFEGQSNSLMEALAAGIPVVASDIPPNRELVTHGENGFLVPVGDRANFAQVTQRLLDSPELSHQIGAAGRARMAADFSIDAFIASHVMLYQDVLA